MSGSEKWKWEFVKDDESNIWKNPSVESYYLLHRWKEQNKKEFLDLGCGLGRHSILFGKYGFNVHCFDINEEAIVKTKEWAESESLDFEYNIGDMRKLPYKDESMDYILSRNVISHTDTQGVKQTIAEIHRVLKVGAECYLTLASKDAQGFKRKDWPSLDENTKITMEEGAEYKIPHFYADYNLIEELFRDFEIISITHVEEFREKNGKINSVFQYHVHVKK